MTKRRTMILHQLTLDAQQTYRSIQSPEVQPPSTRQELLVQSPPPHLNEIYIHTKRERVKIDNLAEWLPFMHGEHATVRSEGKVSEESGGQEWNSRIECCLREATENKEEKSRVAKAKVNRLREIGQAACCGGIHVVPLSQMAKPSCHFYPRTGSRRVSLEFDVLPASAGHQAVPFLTPFKVQRDYDSPSGSPALV